MNNYWKNFYNSDDKKFEASLFKQVDKTVNGKEINEQQLKLIVDSIANVLRLNAKDLLIDLCCGNGLITRKLAPLVKEVVGVDFSSCLIEVAEKNSSFSNIKYINSDVLALAPNYFLNINKIVMFEGLQYFSKEQFSLLLDAIKSLAPGSLVFFGGIPNKDKLQVFYDTEEKYAFFLHRERNGKPHIGRWWLMNEIEELASTRSFKTICSFQNPELYTAHYRFDALLEKR